MCASKSRDALCAECCIELLPSRRSVVARDLKLAKFTAMLFPGEGGFGFVVHCRKKSTGKHYAMKLQTKKGNVHARNARFISA
jgi:hypothetical protein